MYEGAGLAGSTNSQGCGLTFETLICKHRGKITGGRRHSIILVAVGLNRGLVIRVFDSVRTPVVKPSLTKVTGYDGG